MPENLILFQLSSTKDLENKITLLHYLVETIDQKFPELLNFGDELSHIDKASRVSTDIIQKALNIMESNVKNLETDLANNKISQDEDDKFSEVMGVSFLFYNLLFVLFRSISSWLRPKVLFRYFYYYSSQVS